MAAVEWPKQNTGLFAVPACVQCCTFEPSSVDTCEIRMNNASWYTMVGVGPFDGSGGALYRTVTWSGTITVKMWDGSDGCESGELPTSTAIYSGTSTMDLGDSGTATGNVQCTQDGSLIADATIVGGGYLTAPNGVAGDGVEVVDSGPVETMTGTDTCSQINQTTPMMSRTTGAAAATLSNECTEADAIAWHEEQYTGWEDWFGISLDSKFPATWAAYVPGVAGQYAREKLQFRRTKGGFIPGASYVCTLDVWRGADQYSLALYATLEETLVANSSGELVWTGDVPFARGYSTAIDPQSFTAAPA